MFDNFFLFDCKVLLAEIFLLIILLFILFFFLFIVNNRYYKYPFIVFEVNSLLLFIFFISFLIVLNNPLNNFIIFNNLLFLDNLLYLTKLFILFAMFCTVFVSFNFLQKTKVNCFEYSILILFAVIGVLCFISSYDLVALFLALEIQSLSFYILATLKKDSAFATEAGLKYFILGALSSGFLLFGISLIYGIVGTLNFEALAKFILNFDYGLLYDSQSIFHFEYTERLILGLVFIMAGFFFKMAAAPFHFWAPDVYEGAPTNVSMIFAVVPKVGLFVVFVRLFYYVFFDLIFIWQNITVLIALISIFFGSMATLRQLRIKRFLAFSSITHVGFLLMAFSTGTFEGLVALFFYLVFYVIMSLNIWTTVLFLELKTLRLKYLTDLQNLAKVNPIIGLTLLVNLFSMAGVPPFAGFYSKSYVFLSALDSSLYFLVVIGILFSVISAFYYIRFTKIIFFDKVTNIFYFKQIVDIKQAYVLGFSFLLICFFFIYPEILFLVIEKALLQFY